MTVKLPNAFLRSGWRPTNSFATSINEKLSRRSLLSYMIDKELSLFCDILERSHVFILLNIEKDLSGVAEVAPFVKIIFMMVTTFWISLPFSGANDFITLTTSSRFIGGHSSSKIVGSSWSSAISDVSS